MQPIQLRTLPEDPNGVQPAPTNGGHTACYRLRKFVLWFDAFCNRYCGALILNLAYGPNGLIATTLLVHLSRMFSVISAPLQLPLLAMAEAHLYMFCIVDAFNDGLPRAAWTTIGLGDVGNPTNAQNIHRFSLIYTLITVQCLVGLVLSVVLFVTAPHFALLFSPTELHGISTTYLRICAFNAFPSAIMAAVGNGVRAYGETFFANFLQVTLMMSQMAFITGMSTHHYPGVEDRYPSLIGLAAAPLAGSFVGVFFVVAIFFFYVRWKLRGGEYHRVVWFSYPLFLELLESGKWTFLESAIRNAVYMWQAHNVISLGTGYATIWAMFNVVHRQTVGIPIRSLELTSNMFLGHNWGIYLDRKNDENAGGSTDGNTEGDSEGLRRSNVASWREIREIISPALKSIVVGLILTLPLFVWLFVDGAVRISTDFGGKTLAKWVGELWRVTGVGFALWSVATQLGCCIMIMSPRWYCYQSVVLSVAYILPCDIIITILKKTVAHIHIWDFNKWMFAGNYVSGAVIVSVAFAILVAKMRGCSSLVNFKI